ncbi:MAG TPA: hypothetical protein P5059_03645 [Candidatus Dojkabacteria bacterium]|nr:hypothetical protein [Candidatus Dojkabacteria bacterium]
MNINNCKKILVLGDSGRGKSTLSKKLSDKYNLRYIELDDIFWIKKFTKKRTDEEQIKLLKEILANEEDWIIEGSTRHLVSVCLEVADCILHLSFKNILMQWFYVLRRGFARKDSIKESLNLCIHLYKKRYGLGNSKGKESVRNMIKPFSEKVIELDSWEKINRIIDKGDLKK